MAVTMRFRGTLQFAGGVAEARRGLASRELSGTALALDQLRFVDIDDASELAIDVTTSGPAASFERTVELLVELGVDAVEGGFDCVLVADGASGFYLALPHGEREPLPDAALRRWHADLVGA